MPRKNWKGASCHPDKMVLAKGLCRTCYQREYRRGNHTYMGKKLPAEDIELSAPKEGVLGIDDLIRTVADLCFLSYADAQKVVYGIFSVMIRELRGGGKVKIKGMGTWKLRTRKAHTGWVKQIGTIHVPERRYVEFKPDKWLKYIVSPERYT